MYVEDITPNRKRKIIVYIPESRFKEIGLVPVEEAKQETVGRYTAYRHAPHYQGGEYHGVCELPGGYEISYTMTGHRRHPNKFPTDDKIPKDAKMAIAKVLGVSADVFESYVAYDEIEREDVILLRLKSKAVLLIERCNSLTSQD